MPDFIPTAQEQLKFLKNIQLILQSGSFSSTYKFALLISLSRLAIEKGEDSGESLSLEYTDIAEKFIELIYAELSGDFPLGDSRQPTYKSLRPFDLVS